jgi:nicotinamide-nucleotide amidase
MPMPSNLVLESSKILSLNKLTISFAESASAGSLCAAYALTPESGKILKGGIVCYDAILKEQIFKIPASLIKKYTPESAEVTEQLSIRLKKLINSDFHIAMTGLTTDRGSETKEKPVGTTFIHILFRDKSVGVREVYKGSPEEIIGQTIDRVAKMIIGLIKEG